MTSKLCKFVLEFGISLIIGSGKVRQTQLSRFVVYYVDGDYMFRPLFWAIIRSQELQVRRLYSVQTLAMEHTSINFFFNEISSLRFASQSLYILQPNSRLKICEVHYPVGGCLYTV